MMKKLLRAMMPVLVLFISSNVASSMMEEVVVTAQKRSESLQDVPIAVNALTGDNLDDMGVLGSDDLTKIFPNLSMKATTSINSGFSIRGVGTNNFHITAQQAVGTYADEVSLASPFTSQFGLFDMERVEILRGPQNTLFGRNTTGGAVNFISRKPSPGEELNGYARVVAGNEGKLDGEFAVSFPISDNVAARLALQSVNRDGVFNNVITGKDIGDIERQSGRFQIAWEPTNSTEVLLNFHVGYNRSDRGPRKSVGYWQAGSPNIGTPGARGAPDCPVLSSISSKRFESANGCVTAINGLVFDPSTPDDWNDVRDVAPLTADVDFEGGFVKVIHDFDTLSLTSITSWDTIDVQFVENSSGTGVTHFYPGQEGDFEIFSQELRLTSLGDEDFRWIGGLYYSTEDDQLATIIRNGSDRTPPFTVVPSVAIDQDVEIFSAYGQVEYDFNDVLTLTAGLRFTRDEKDGVSISRVLAGTTTGFVGAPMAASDYVYNLAFLEAATAGGVGRCPPPVGGLPCILSFEVEQELEEWGGKVGLDWKVGESTLIYTSYSRGFKSGAFDTRALAAFFGNADKPVGPEFLDAYEVGVKTTLLQDSMDVSAAFFYYEWEDLQAFATDARGAPAFLNVPETELKGIEVEVKWSPADGWYLQGGIGWIDSEITDDGGLNSVKEGAPVSNSPEWTMSGLIRRELELDGGLLSFQTSFSYEDETNSSNADLLLQRIDSTFFINARASYLFGDAEQYEVAVWGENLTEEKTCAQLGDEGNLTNSITCLLNPGMAFYGVSLEYQF